MMALALMTACGTAAWWPTAGYAQTSSSELLACQRKLESRHQHVARYVAQRLHLCVRSVTACKLEQEIDAENSTECLNKAIERRCTGLPVKVAEKRTRARDAMLKKCNEVPLSELEQFVAGLGFANVVSECDSLPTPPGPVTVSTVPNLIDCLLATSQCTAERELFIGDPRAQDALATAEIEVSFPCVGP